MNKHIVNVLSNYDFEFIKNMGYGHIEGYEINVVNNLTAPGPVFFISTFLNDSKKEEFVLKLNNHKFKLVQADIFDLGVIVMIGSMTASSFEKKYNEVMPIVLEILKELEAPKADICPKTGELLDEINSKKIKIDALSFKLSNKAIDELNSSVEEENEAYENQPNNYLKGVLGLLIGGVSGVILTIIFAYFGMVSALAPVASIILGIYLYKKFGGKETGVMIILSFVITLVLILSSLIVMYIITAMAIAKEQGEILIGFDALYYCYQFYPGFNSSFLTDIGLNIAFTLIAEGFLIFRLVKMIKRPKKIN